MITVHAVLLIVAFICFVLAALGVQSRIAFGWAGLAFWVLSLLLV